MDGAQALTPADAPPCRPNAWDHAPCPCPYPAAILARIADDAGVPPTALHVLEVGLGHALFTAALDYAARAAAQVVTVDAAGGAAPSGRTFWVNPSDAVEWAGAATGGGGHDGASDVQSAVATAVKEAADGGDEASAVAKVLAVLAGPPKLLVKAVAGTGAAAVVWPPPPGATAAALRAALREGRGGGATAEMAAAKGAAPVPPVVVAGEATNGGTAAVVNGGPTLPPTDASLIYVVHYFRGDPVHNDCGAPKQSRSVLLVSAAAGGDASLITFARGVVAWRRALYAPIVKPLTYSMRRFRSYPAGYGDWVDEGVKPGRSLTSVVLPGDMAADIADDVRSFLTTDAKAWYRRHGLPYRRSYLLHGTPGSGKTSTIRAIASTFGLTACFLSVTTDRFNNQLLADSLRDLPTAALVVLEDVDALFGADRAAKAGSAALTFSGLLNALDGLTAAESVLVALTTNARVADLDPALIRGGRVDRRWAFGPPSAAQLSGLFAAHYPDAAAADADAFAVALSGGLGPEALSMAAAQQLFISHRRSTSAECLAAVPAWAAEYVSGQAAVQAADEAAAERAATEAAATAKAADGGTSANGGASADGGASANGAASADTGEAAKER